MTNICPVTPTQFQRMPPTKHIIHSVHISERCVSESALALAKVYFYGHLPNQCRQLLNYIPTQNVKKYTLYFFKIRPTQHCECGSV